MVPKIVTFPLSKGKRSGHIPALKRGREIASFALLGGKDSSESKMRERPP
jgi:hypothetical protein